MGRATPKIGRITEGDVHPAHPAADRVAQDALPIVVRMADRADAEEEVAVVDAVAGATSPVTATKRRRGWFLAQA